VNQYLLTYRVDRNRTGGKENIDATRRKADFSKDDGEGPLQYLESRGGGGPSALNFLSDEGGGGQGNSDLPGSPAVERMVEKIERNGLQTQ